jgi:precorrin-3B synthase
MTAAAQRDAVPPPGGENYPNLTLLSVGLPFGRISAKDLSCLARAASAVGASELRLTPWRVLLVPVPSPGAAQTLAAALSRTHFILDPGDPRCRIAACPGSPACTRGTTAVREDAEVLAKALARSPMMATEGSGITLHVSGCEKGCAHPRKAQFTLVGRDGRYSLVRNGRASDCPVARDLTLDQAANLLIGQSAAGVP